MLDKEGYRHNSEYGMLIAFPHQQWLCERALILRPTYISCLGYFFLFVFEIGFYFFAVIPSLFSSSTAQKTKTTSNLSMAVCGPSLVSPVLNNIFTTHTFTRLAHTFDSQPGFEFNFDVLVGKLSRNLSLALFRFPTGIAQLV
jgi:hypothetical protein